MSILSILNIKSKLEEAFSKENLQNLFEKIKEQVIEKVSETITGEEKAEKVKTVVTEWVTKNITSSNKIVQWCIDNILIKFLPNLIQYVYDLLKEKVDGLTK